MVEPGLNQMNHWSVYLNIDFIGHLPRLFIL